MNTTLVAVFAVAAAQMSEADTYVNTTETLNSTQTFTSQLHIGSGGNGNVTITDVGATTTPVTVTTQGYGIVLGDNAGNTGTLQVSGGATSANSQLYVGNQGTGIITVDGGTSGGAAYDGTKLTDSGDLNIAFNASSTGTVTLQNGGVANITGSVNMGANTTTNATLTLNTGASLTFGGTLAVGNNASATATLNITGGSTFTGTANTASYIAGSAAGSVGTVTIDGAGSSLSLMNNVYNGSNGNGTVTVQSGGNFSVANTLVLGASAGSVGTLNIGATAFNTTGGTVTAGGGITTQSGMGTINFNQTNAFTLTPVASGAIAVNQRGTGTTTLTSASNSYTGVTTVSGGTLLINGTNSGAGAVNITGGTLGGSGSVAGLLTVSSGATVTGGATGAVGMLTLTNTTGATLNSGSIYSVDINSTASDNLKLTGVLTITSGAKLTFSGTEGAAKYDLANYASETGTFTATNLPAGYALTYGATELDLVAVPEPSTWMMGGLCLGVLGFHLRRRSMGAV